MGDAVPGKVCVRCAADVSGAARVKDAQGRYYCAGCAEAVKREAAKGQRTAGSEQRTLGSGGGGGGAVAPTEFAGLQVCGGCGSSVPYGGVVCVQCGMNQETGAVVTTAVVAAEPEREYADPMVCTGCGGKLKSVSKRTCPACGTKNRKLSARERGKAFSQLMLRDELRKYGLIIGVGTALTMIMGLVWADNRGVSLWLGALAGVGWMAVDAAIGLLLYLLVSLLMLGRGDAMWLIALRVLSIAVMMPWAGTVLSLVPIPFLPLLAYLLLLIDLVARFLDMDYYEAGGFAFVWAVASWFGTGPAVVALFQLVGLLETR